MEDKTIGEELIELHSCTNRYDKTATHYNSNIATVNMDPNIYIKRITQDYLDRFKSKFDDDMFKQLSEMLDNEDVATHHLAFRLIYNTHKNI